MRTSRSAAVLALLAALLVAPAAIAAPETFSVDASHSSVGFSIRHFVTTVPGSFNEFSGTVVYDAENPSASTFEMTVQAASIDTRQSDRDKHLRSPDFFDVEQFPTLTFKSTSVAGSGDKLAVTGDFTLRGITQRLTVPVEVLGTVNTPMGVRSGFAAEFTIHRKDFGIVWNRVLDQGGTMLGEDVKVTISVEAVRQ